MSSYIFQPMSANIWLYLFVIAVLEALLLYFWRFRKLPGAMPQVYAQACKVVWILGFIMISISADLQTKLWWLSLQHISLVLLAYAWFMFIMEISDQDKIILRAVKLALRGILLILGLVSLSNNWHGWYWPNAWLSDGMLKIVRGPAVWLLMGGGSLLCLASLVFSMRWVLAASGWRRRQAMVIIAAPIISLTGNLVWIVARDTVPLARELGFLLSGIYIAWVYRQWLIFRILPQAQEVVLRNMIDGLLIIDDEDYIVDMNPAVKEIFVDFPATVGGNFREIVAAWPALAELGGDMGVNTIEVVSEYPEGRRYYQVNITSLDSQGSLLGKVIVFKDITKQKQIQTKLFEQQQALAILTERNRLGRELHDGQGQIWSYLQLELQTVRSLLNGAQLTEAKEQVERLARIAKDLNVDVRESIAGLNQKADSCDFVATLREYLTWYEKNHGIATRLILPTESVAQLFNRTSEVQLLRIIQEALTNIRKHAKARQVEISIQMADNQVTVLVVDDGCGFEVEASHTEKKGYGLQVMEERAKEAKGQLRITSKPGEGTTIMVHFFLGKVDGNENNAC